MTDNALRYGLLDAARRSMVDLVRPCAMSNHLAHLREHRAERSLLGSRQVRQSLLVGGHDQ